MLHSPITTSSPLLPLSVSISHGCKNDAIDFTGVSTISCSASSEAGSKLATSAAINIPSPPLTPYLGGYAHGDDDVEILHQHSHYLHSRSRYHIDQFDSSVFSSGPHNTAKSTTSVQDLTRNLQERRQQDHRKQFQQQYPQDKMSIFRYSTSAPSSISPLGLRASRGTPSVGFTFSSNISTGEPKEERESYANIMNKMEQDYWKSVSTIRSTYFFDGIGRGGGFLAIPHLASHGNAKTNVICRLLEAWLTKKLVEPTISDSIPVLEDNIQSSVQSIERHLKSDPKVWAGISQAFIHIRCGHVFMLDACCDDETIVHLGADEFYQDYPLFVDVEIKMQGDVGQLPRRQPTEVLIAFQNVVNREKEAMAQRTFVHRAYVDEPLFTSPTTTSPAFSSRQSLDERIPRTCFT
ncbi:hypothetical protein EDD11_005133 [Mortierella claussenii]|nr:hypothetical protein EDD11_005133 [Mortierella claussenii]